MKGLALGVLLVLALPISAFANSARFCVDCQPYSNSDATLIGAVADLSPSPYIGYLTNGGGTLTGSDAGLTLTGSNLTEIRGISGDLGTVTITTGALFYGSLQSGGLFSTVGSSLTITLNPNVLGGKLSGGAILFSGTFGPTLNGGTAIYWSIVQPGLYELYGVASGILPNGTYGQAFVHEFYYGSFNSNGVFTGTMGGGQIVVNPEPGTVGLFVTGLVGIAGAIRRKLRA